MIAAAQPVAPDTSSFSVIKTTSSHWYDVDEDNLPDYVEAAICSLTGDQCEGFFRHTGH